ncbi:MAG: GNAT family N-acetyltransferase [Chloroflexi bacterium]|nr:GNAT family N-acetyltransferase [Chloroflexota bacterium]
MTLLETERLCLRTISEDDADFILELLNEPAFIRNIGDRQVRSSGDARQYIQSRVIHSYETHGFGMYLVERKEDGLPLGICGLVRRETLEDVDIGFAFLERYWSQGYASESAAAVMAYARETLGIGRIVGIVDPANGGSMRVLEKLGLKFARLVRLSAEDIELKLFTPDGQ